MRILSTVLISYVSWVLANSMTESSSCFWKCNRISGQRFCIMVCWNFGLIVIYISAPIIESWWWVVMAVRHCYSWRLWWSETLWATLKVIWALIVVLPSMFCCGDFSAILMDMMEWQVQSSEDPRVVILMECWVYFCQGCSTSSKHTRSALHIWRTCKGGHLWWLAFGLKLGGSSIKWHGSGSSCKHSLNNPHFFFPENPVS